MNYFAYGSNMSIRRLRVRTPSASPLGLYTLPQYQLRVHKAGMDGSAKCNAFFTGNANDRIQGVLFKIDPSQRPNLDRAEGLGRGYDAQIVRVESSEFSPVEALIYIATQTDESLLPFDWYMNHVIRGAVEAGFSPADCEKLKAFPTIEDADKERAAREFSLYS